MTDISAIIVFHAEGALASASLQSFRQVVANARDADLSVQSIIIMDSATSDTKAVVARGRASDDLVMEVDFRDLSRTRNAALDGSSGEWTAFFDGDDLWGGRWLTEAHNRAQRGTPKTIWHPEYLYYFSEHDFFVSSLTRQPSHSATSYFMRQVSSNAPGFDPKSILFDNLWSAHCFCRRELHAKYPYQAFDRTRGLGVEDWSWNAKTLFDGIAHDVVPGTVHIIRVKETGSLGVQNSHEGLLPNFSDDVRSSFYHRGATNAAGWRSST